MPELAAMGALGFGICWLLNIFFYLRLRSHYQSATYRRVQQNLNKLQLYWSDHRGELAPLATQALVEQDQRQALNSFLVTATIASFASWFGVIFMALLITSLNYLAKSRLETVLFEGPLAQKSNLEHGEISTWLSQQSSGEP